MSEGDIYLPARRYGITFGYFAMKGRAMTHTPGPWGIHRYTNDCGFEAIAIVPKNGNKSPQGWIVDNLSFYENSPPPEALANARLIAAAPKLLEACKEALEDARTIFNSVKDKPVGSGFNDIMSKSAAICVVLNQTILETEGRSSWEERRKMLKDFEDRRGPAPGPPNPPRPTKRKEFS